MSRPIANLLLECLSNDRRAALLSQMEPVELPLRCVLFQAEERPRYVHFVTSGIASVVTNMESGQAVEIGLVGNEGFAEKLHVLGPQVGVTQCFMQMAGTGLRMDYKRFQAEFLQDPELRSAVHEYVQSDAMVLGQLGACNRLHEVEPRLARWLLMVGMRVGEPEFRLTQEFIGEMLGARRSSVNLAAGSLQNLGAIQYSRGKIRILDKTLLESIACECYPIIEKLYVNLYQS